MSKSGEFQTVRIDRAKFRRAMVGYLALFVRQIFMNDVQDADPDESRSIGSRSVGSESIGSDLDSTQILLLIVSEANVVDQVTRIWTEVWPLRSRGQLGLGHDVRSEPIVMN